MDITETDIRTYYHDCFPLDAIKEWIQYECNGVPQEPLDQRECAFWFDEERFARWSSIERMYDLVRNPTASPPVRMEIGPVYSHRLVDRKGIPTGQFFAVHRELVFDLDADDFKDIKHCCGDSEICEKCWPYMECALECLIKALTENFGFKYILPVFSGRRGIHIWVCDQRARELSGPVRDKIVKYLNLREIVSKPDWREDSCPLAKSMLETCEKYFLKIIANQQIFTHEKIKGKVESLVSNAWIGKIMEGMSDRYSGDLMERWEAIKQQKLTPNGKRFCQTPHYYRLIFNFSFPGLDANVTTTMNHLLKSPFSYHPKSGLISVPIPYEMRSVFPYHWVPTLKSLVTETENSAEMRDIYRRSVDEFRKFVASTTGKTDEPSAYLQPL